MKEKSLNVYGKPLQICGNEPITGAFRDGCCNTGPGDIGTHTVCAIVSDEFLEFSTSRGNDLTRDYPEYNFKGLREGDHWCLCASRWLEAFEAEKAPKVILKSTNMATLSVVKLEYLKKYSI